MAIITKFLNGTVSDDTLLGTSVNDVINGGLGADYMMGGLGDDTYVVDNAGDLVVEFAGQGNDTVQSSISYVLGSDVENLTLIGAAAINATGNDVNNVLRGDANSAANSLTGGLGNDTYYVGTGDTVVENSGEGTDTVVSSVSYTLGANVENLTLANGYVGLSGTGNDSNNAITGTAYNDTIDGGAGADTMQGGSGNDTYVVDNTGDIIVEAAYTPKINYNIDTVKTSVNYTLAANVENMVFTAAGPLTGTGNALSNTYTVNNSADVIIEALNAGNDSVNSSVNYTLGANIENLTLTGAAAINATGNDLNNVLKGNTNSAANVLAGGLGDDTYYVGAGDTVVDTGGTDTVVSSVSYALGANVENLTLTGTLGLIGVGNAGDNVIVGSSGRDTLLGNGGNDTFVFKSAVVVNNVDTIADFTAGDNIALSLAMFGGVGATGALSATAFVSGAGMTAAATADQHIIFNTTSGTLYYDADGAGGTASVAFATLTGAPSVIAADFTVV